LAEETPYVKQRFLDLKAQSAVEGAA